MCRASWTALLSLCRRWARPSGATTYGYLKGDSPCSPHVPLRTAVERRSAKERAGNGWCACSTVAGQSPLRRVEPGGGEANGNGRSAVAIVTTCPTKRYIRRLSQKRRCPTSETGLESQHDPRRRFHSVRALSGAQHRAGDLGGAAQNGGHAGLFSGGGRPALVHDRRLDHRRQYQHGALHRHDRRGLRRRVRGRAVGMGQLVHLLRADLDLPPVSTSGAGSTRCPSFSNGATIRPAGTCSPSVRSCCGSSPRWPWSCSPAARR